LKAISASVLKAISASVCVCFPLHIGKHNDKKEYKLLDNILESYQNIRDLGIIIDKGLSFDDHINKIIRNAYFKIYQLLRILKTRDSDTLLRAYKAYIRPQLEYATEVWNPTKKGSINEIEKVKKHFTRRLFKIIGLTPTKYKERLLYLNLKELQQRRNVSDLVMAHKIITNQTHLKPERYFSFAKMAKRKIYCLQHRKLSRKTYNNFFTKIIPTWNKLPNDILKIYKSKKFRENVSLKL